jgi:hypothetical protein
VYLSMALCAVRIKRSLQSWVRPNVTQQRPVVRARRSSAMARMASQAKEGRRLMQQIVGDRSVGTMANAAVLGHWRMLVGEGALFFRVAPVAHLVN